MSASSRLLARLLPLALPLTFACGAKSELLAEDPNADEDAPAAGGTAGRGGSAGRTASGGNTTSAGGTLAATGGSGPVATGGSGTVSVGGTGGGTVSDLPQCPQADGNCLAACYAGAPDEPCLPSFPPEPVWERFGCQTQLSGGTTVTGQKPGECCYIVGFCGGGRPLFAEGHALVAALECDASWI